MKKIYILLLLALLPTILFADWPMFMGNQYLTGNNDEIVPDSNALNWVFTAPSYLYSPISHKNKIFVNCCILNLNSFH